MTTAIVDLELGNIGSMSNMLKHIGERAEVIADPNALVDFDRIILPGVGSFDACMKQIDNGGWREALTTAALDRKTPLLGVCLGMQVLCRGSEEGAAEGLGFIDGFCIKFDRSAHPDIRIPHMGWNEVKPSKKVWLFQGLDERNKFYFTHSYHMVLRDRAREVASCLYGDEFVCAVSRDNVFGVQFHPEKSHSYGKRLLSNFVAGHA